MASPFHVEWTAQTSALDALLGMAKLGTSGRFAWIMSSPVWLFSSSIFLAAERANFQYLVRAFPVPFM